MFKVFIIMLMLDTSKKHYYAQKASSHYIMPLNKLITLVIQIDACATLQCNRPVRRTDAEFISYC